MKNFITIVLMLFAALQVNAQGFAEGNNGAVFGGMTDMPDMSSPQMNISRTSRGYGSSLSYRVSSPDKKIQANLLVQEGTQGRSKFVKPQKKMLDVVRGRESIIRNRELDLVIKADGHRYDFGKSEIVMTHDQKLQKDAPISCINDKGESLELSGTYNGLTMETECGVTLELRVYDGGVAYRYLVRQMAGEYKILAVSYVLPDEKPIAILGTFNDDYVFPWSIMTIEADDNGEPAAVSPVQAFRPVRTISKVSGVTGRPNKNGVVSWRDALSSYSVGGTFNWFSSGAWKNVAQTMSFSADFTYKYIYGGLTYSPCNELLYLYYDEDYDPFIRVMGSVHSWAAGARIGFALPIQNGYNVWTITPYCAASLLHLQQHGRTRPAYNDVNPHHYYLIGPGVKVQCGVRERLTIGFSYEYQLFTGEKTPRGMNSLGVSFGFIL